MRDSFSRSEIQKEGGSLVTFVGVVECLLVGLDGLVDVAELEVVVCVDEVLVVLEELVVEDLVIHGYN